MKRLIRSLKLALAGKNLSRLQKRFAEVEDFRGLDYECIVGRVGARANETQLRNDGQTARTWLEENYSITLLFNGTGICLGVEEERS